MNDAYAYWKAAVAGEKPKMYVDSPECGFYRMAIREQQPLKNGQGLGWKRVGWMPVAIFKSPTSDKLAAVIGIGRDAKIDYHRDRLNDLWSNIAANPISEATYRAVAERGEPWPDSHETVASMMKPSEDNKIAQHEFLEIRLEGWIGELPRYSVIDSDEMASQARSLQQWFLDAKSEAEEAYETVNRPLLDEQKRLRSIWFPLRDKAGEASDTLRKAMGTWEDEKRKAAKVAAERAEAGQDNAASNVPPPATQIRGGAGRAATVSVNKVVTAINDMVFEQFRTNPEVVSLLFKLAQKAINSGIDVPGATYEERSVVR